LRMWELHVIRGVVTRFLAPCRALNLVVQ
jgi:hypothetical protein